MNRKKSVSLIHTVVVLRSQERNVDITVGNSIKMLVQCSLGARKPYKMLGFIRIGMVKKKKNKHKQYVHSMHIEITKINYVQHNDCKFFSL